MNAPEDNRNELINSFVDGELSPRQRTEVKRLAAHDQDVAKQIRQVNNCRNLLRSLPREDPPEEIMENLRTLLERRSLLDKKVLTEAERGGRFVILRRIRSAAAVLLLLGGLSILVFNILAPLKHGGLVTMVNPSSANKDLLGTQAVALETQAVYELHIAKHTDLAGELDRIVAEQGLRDAIARHVTEQGQESYQIQCNKQAMGRILARLQGVWGAVNSSQLVLTNDVETETVVLDQATPALVARVLDQDSAEETFSLARTVLASRQESPFPLIEAPPINKPVLTSGTEASGANTLLMTGEGQTKLTLVLLHDGQ